MQDIEVTLSALNQAEASIREKVEAFRNQAQQTLNAANELHDGWEGDSYQAFGDRIEDLKRWMDDMANIMDTYADALKKAAQDYQSADETSATNFR